MDRKLETLTKVTEEVAARHPDSPRVRDAAARQALQARDWERGMRHADAAVEKAAAAGDKAVLVDALRTRAAAAWHAQDYPKAEADAKCGLELKPGDDRLNGIYQLSKGRGRGAAPAAGAPSSAPGAEAKLVSWLDDPRLREAGARATARVEALKHLEEARRRLGVGDPRGALAPLDAALGADPLLSDAYMHRALAWSAIGELAKALIDV
ncbi:MAG: hypothetical protein SF051_14200, partial [Elusimicrobiota bacterium]|nr:hypothetical protein [Elusimicrobiota bacterium]